MLNCKDSIHVQNLNNSQKDINFSNFNTNKVTNMSVMFSKCTLLKKLELDNFNTKNVKDMSYIFSGCLSLKKLNLSNFNTKNVTDMSYMFSGCSKELQDEIKSKYDDKFIKNAFIMVPVAINH